MEFELWAKENLEDLIDDWKVEDKGKNNFLDYIKMIWEEKQ